MSNRTDPDSGKKLDCVVRQSAPFGAAICSPTRRNAMRGKIGHTIGHNSDNNSGNTGHNSGKKIGNAITHSGKNDNAGKAGSPRPSTHRNPFKPLPALTQHTALSQTLAAAAKKRQERQQ